VLDSVFVRDKSTIYEYLFKLCKKQYKCKDESDKKEKRELNEIRKMNRIKGWGMGSEGSWFLAFLLLPSLPISINNSTLSGSFGQMEENGQRVVK